MREHNKNCAEKKLSQAHFELQSEQKKLTQIKRNLVQTINGRSALQENFFVRAQNGPINKSQTMLMASILQKNLSSEQSIKKSLDQQEEAVKQAYERKNSAMTDAVEAQRELKIINKHHSLWQLNHKKYENLKAEYENDDQNGMRFWSRRQRV